MSANLRVVHHKDVGLVAQAQGQAALDELLLSRLAQSFGVA